MEKAASGQYHQRDGLSNSSQALIPLSQLYNPPSPHKIHPGANQVIEQVQQWLYPHLEQLGAEKLIKGIIDETASACAYLYPNADDEGIFLVTGFLTVQFINDDMFDSATIRKAIRATPSGQCLARDVQKLRDTPQRLADGICCETMSDLETDLFLLGAVYELSTHFGKSHALIYTEPKDMTFEEYADYRVRNSGLIYSVLFVEMVTGNFLSDEQKAIPQISQMQQHCERLGSLLNEIFSYEKETFLKSANNPVAVLMREEGIGLYEAARRVAAMAQRHAEEITRIKVEIDIEYGDGNDKDAGLRSYVGDMELFGAANWFWQLEGTKRYSSKTSPFVELRLVNGDSEIEAEEGAR
ncbi:terpene synthase [Fusarium pseudoanthophilum]|uniref:Terpene synthase n=1 Tax=Fusarium pseudoanthophilum TaxID=48495 RepID=A0A8H5KPR8_9HYPO|nr:terpene synthase [Fusarium pseudoanthophilum]